MSGIQRNEGDSKKTGSKKEGQQTKQGMKPLPFGRSTQMFLPLIDPKQKDGPHKDSAQLVYSANKCLKLGDIEGAITHAEAALALVKTHTPVDVHELTCALDFLATCLVAKGNYERAMCLHDEVYEILIEHFKRDILIGNWDTPAILIWNRGVTYYEMKNLEIAHTCFATAGRAFAYGCQQGLVPSFKFDAICATMKRVIEERDAQNKEKLSATQQEGLGSRQIIEKLNTGTSAPTSSKSNASTAAVSATALSNQGDNKRVDRERAVPTVSSSSTKTNARRAGQGPSAVPIPTTASFDGGSPVLCASTASNRSSSPVIAKGGENQSLSMAPGATTTAK